MTVATALPRNFEAYLKGNQPCSSWNCVTRKDGSVDCISRNTGRFICEYSLYQVTEMIDAGIWIVVPESLKPAESLALIENSFRRTPPPDNVIVEVDDFEDFMTVVQKFCERTDSTVHCFGWDSYTVLTAGFKEAMHADGRDDLLSLFISVYGILAAIRVN